MNYTEPSFVISFFDDFFRYVLQQKQRLMLHIRESHTQDQYAQTSQDLAHVIITDLKHFLRQQQQQATAYGGGFALSKYNESQYVMVALADEIFLHIDWPGQKVWEDNILEMEFFNSHIAGENVFNKIDQILQMGATTTLDLASTYLFALGLGFKGRYRNPGDESHLNSYRDRLYQFILEHAPNILQSRKHLCPQANQCVFTENNISYLPDNKIRYMAGLGFMILFFCATYGGWYYFTKIPHQEMRDIIAQARIEM